MSLSANGSTVNCAIFAPGGVLTPSAMFGKDVANVAFYRALLRHPDLDAIRFCLHDVVPPQHIIDTLKPGEVRPHVTTASMHDPSALQGFGTLFRGKADLSDLAWRRRRSLGDRSHSLVGLVHCIAPPAIRKYIAAAAIAPVQPWDALICTSPVVQRNLARMFEEFSSHLCDRFGAGKRKVCAPMLSLIPLGVDSKELGESASSSALRSQGRAELGLDDYDVLVLWVGRLSYYEKAAPQPMFQALEEAVRRGAGSLHFVMVGWFPGGDADRKAYEEAAHLHAPSLRVHFFDGSDQTVVRRMWAAGDIFLSLIDNIQETFGLAPIEAMAAGLPIVASNWDGYRATIEHGRQGMLVDTLIGPSGLGQGMLDRHIMGAYSYQQYAGGVAQHTAVHIGQAADAIVALAQQPHLRKQFGAAGRERAGSVFDWSVVINQTIELFRELMARREATPSFEVGAPSVKTDPINAEPFEDFRDFATDQLGVSTVLSRPIEWSNDSPERLEQIQLNKFMSGWRATSGERDQIFSLFERDVTFNIAELLALFPLNRRSAIAATVMWMCKLGLLEWNNPVLVHRADNCARSAQDS